MALRSNNPKHSVYFEVPSVVMDTCAITWIAKQADGIGTLDQLLRAYRLLIPTPVLYELAFGPPELADANEHLIRSKLSDSRMEADHFKYSTARQNGQIKAGGYYLINPGYMEWWSARERLLRYIALSNAKHGASKKKHSLDALIHSCARNTFAPICTLNVDDFQKMNKAGGLRTYDGTVPIVTPEQLLQAITLDIHCSE